MGVCATQAGSEAASSLSLQPPERDLESQKTRVTFTISPGLLQKLDGFCEENSRSRSLVISWAVMALLYGVTLYSQIMKGKRQPAK